MWLLSLGALSVRFTHAVGRSHRPVFFGAAWYSVVWTCYNLCIDFPVICIYVVSHLGQSYIVLLRTFLYMPIGAHVRKKRYCTSLECSVTFPHTKKTVTNHNVPQRAERHADRVTASWRMGTGNRDIVKTGCWGHAGMKCWFPHLPKCVLPPSVSRATGRSPLHTFSWGIGGGG